MAKSHTVSPSRESWAGAAQPRPGVRDAENSQTLTVGEVTAFSSLLSDFFLLLIFISL